MRTDYKLLAEEICERVSVQDVARDFGIVFGRDGRCKCVFCGSRRKDTLKLYPGNRGYFCFSCHASGTVVRFYQEMTGAGFREAVEEMNDRYGLGLPVRNADPEAMRRAREESERRKKEAENRRIRENRLLNALWDASDAVWCAEQILKNEGPQKPEDAFSERYEAAAKNLQTLKDWRDKIEIAIMRAKEKTK